MPSFAIFSSYLALLFMTCDYKLSFGTGVDSPIPVPADASKERHFPIEVSEETYYLLEALACANSTCMCKVVEAILLEDIS